jgi:hypothetical protein
MQIRPLGRAGRAIVAQKPDFEAEGPSDMLTAPPMKRLPNGLFLAILPCAGALGCLPASSDVVLRHVSSSENTATLSQRNSGAMSRGSTLVSLLAKGVPDNDTHGVVVLATAWNQPVDMRWIDPKHLELTCPTCDANDVTFEAVKAGDVVISYGNNLSSAIGIAIRLSKTWFHPSSDTRPAAKPNLDKSRLERSRFAADTFACG